jgi:serine/threonine-protein kinase
VPDPFLTSSDRELRAHIEGVLGQHYDLDREIGRGGMGIVFRGVDRRLKRAIAIKVLPPELAFRSEIRTRFLKEAETAAQLSHPNIVPIYSVDEYDNLVYFVMACVDGENIAQLLHRNGVFGSEDTRRVMHQVAEALDYAHTRGVIHRDIKPDNILLDSVTGRAMVSDFGIARAVTDTDSRLTATGIAIGTPAFMSPEQSMGEKEIDGRSDLYSLGVVGYQMLSGELPFSASNTPAMLMKQISELPLRLDRRRDHLPADLCNTIMFLLEKDPANRFQSAGELAAALKSREVREYHTPNPPGGTPASTAAAARPTATTEADEADVASEYHPTDQEMERWNAPKVLRFRGQVARFIPVNLVIFVFAMLTDVDWLFLSLCWSVYMAYRYANLWSEGYDWHDVFRQPADRTFIEVASDFVDQVAALFDPAKRRALRERARRRKLARRSSGGGRAIVSSSPEVPRPRKKAVTSPSAMTAQIVQGSANDRDEIIRIIALLPKEDRAAMSEFARTANALYDRVAALARIASGQSSHMSDGEREIENESRRLEAEANPLDAERSEARVRRLAFLKRQRRSLADVDRGEGAAAARLEECSTALHNMRLDVVRLRAGTESLGQITLLAERAMNLAREVDGVLLANDEVAGRRPGARKL